MIENPYESPKVPNPAGTLDSSIAPLPLLTVLLMTVLLATLGGGFIATVLALVAPGYFPAIIQEPLVRQNAAAFGVLIGLLQGFASSLLLGPIVGARLYWSGQMSWAGYRRTVTLLGACVGIAALGGGLIGMALGLVIPEYYRRIVLGGNRPEFNPVEVGFGLGASQGAVVGAVIGGLSILVQAWRGSRAHVKQKAARPN